MTIRSLAAATCMAAALLAGCGDDADKKPAPKAPAKPPSTKPTTVSGNGYSFTAPAGWSRSQPQNYDNLVQRQDAGAKYPTNATVAIARAAKGFTVRKALPVFRSGLEKQGATGIVRVPVDKVDGDPAIGLRYTLKPGNVTVRQDLVAVIRKGQTYSIGFTAEPARFASARKDFERMLSSWRWR